MAHYPSDWGICAESGKYAYRSRGSAKKAAKVKHPSERLSPYPCGDHWHFGHLDPAVLHGYTTREERYR